MSTDERVRRRVAARLSSAFVLGLIKRGGEGRQMTDVLIRAAVQQANLGYMIRDPALQRRYAGLEDDPPEDLRRPISINALANSLDIPFETVRRRMHVLCEEGFCRITRGGVIVTAAATSSPRFKELLLAQWDDLRALYLRLRDIELYEGLAQPGPPIDPADPPARLTSRYVVEFVLRSIEAIVSGFGDPVGALVLMEVINVNTSILADTEGGDLREGPEGQVPDSLRLPARARALSQRLGVAYETIRRHLSELERRGLCRREADGYVVPGAVLVQPPLLDHVDRNHALLTRLFTGLAEHGVLAHWEAGRGAAKGSAIRA